MWRRKEPASTVFRVSKLTSFWWMRFFQFQLTSEATYEPIVFLKQPYLLHGTISFGETSKTLFENPEIKFHAFADVLSSAKSTFDIVSDTKHCPRQVLKFNPPPQSILCDRNTYKDLTTLHDFGVNITFHNVSTWRLFIEFLCSLRAFEMSYCKYTICHINRTHSGLRVR